MPNPFTIQLQNSVDVQGLTLNFNFPAGANLSGPTNKNVAIAPGALSPQTLAVIDPQLPAQLRFDLEITGMPVGYTSTPGGCIIDVAFGQNNSFTAQIPPMGEKLATITAAGGGGGQRPIQMDLVITPGAVPPNVQLTFHLPPFGN